MRALLLLLAFLVLGNTYGQKEKIKGNKIVSTEQLDVEDFHTIEIHEGFEVTLDESNDNQVKIEADSNLQEVIQVEVVDSVLTIKSDRDMRRAKALNLDISYASELKKIILYDKVNVRSLSPINTTKLIVNANDNAEVFLTADANEVDCITNGKSIVELHVTAQEVTYQINESSEIKGIITTDSLKVDLYQKGYAKLEGEVKSMLVRVDSDTDFYGEKLSVAKTTLIAEGASDCYILTNEEISIEAKDKTEIYLLGEPKVIINTFSNEAILYKKNIDYVPSRFKIN
ncbi:hypothetical protein IWQ47_000225 [Aquimarina sp. EL_43]|uniref:GIN domain-containing protein n=1 Tax=unclassified Aquimarina TaxID=2627091 RepID=UPI0018CBD17E|nr:MULTISPECIES: DUF2807 domain-containing protein [unclassified Aquimarina]MBG6129083.1 hypothetical protein [Aquimarina sp. EL_35]MBG6150148.1 hypothetical protein [Aquimarina sp. EL_32]MBG6167167.1 hypothetical protein [Aquimarina sp. EL_43]